MSTELTTTGNAGYDRAFAGMARSWPGGVKGSEQFRHVGISMMMRDPLFAKCDPMSILVALNDTAKLGLPIDKTLGHMWFIPYGKECKPVIGYKGLVELYRRAGGGAITAREVYENDLFDVDYGDSMEITHKPWQLVGATEPGEVVAAYCITSVNGEPQREIMFRNEIDAVRMRSPSARSGKSPWNTDYAMMARKTVIKRAAKTLPQSAGLVHHAIAIDDAAEIQDAEVIEPVVAIFATTEDAPPEIPATVPEEDGEGWPDELTVQDSP